MLVLYVCLWVLSCVTQCLGVLLLSLCILVSGVVFLCLSCLLVSCMSLCILVSAVVFLCLVCLLAVCLFVLSCVTHDCACACIVCLLVCAVMCDSCLCLCLCCMSACILHLTPCSAKLVCWPVPKTQSKRKIAHSTSSSLSSSSEVNDEFVSHSSVPHSMSLIACHL